MLSSSLILSSSFDIISIKLCTYLYSIPDFTGDLLLPSTSRPLDLRLTLAVFLDDPLTLSDPQFAQISLTMRGEGFVKIASNSESASSEEHDVPSSALLSCDTLRNARINDKLLNFSPTSKIYTILYQFSFYIV